MSNCPLNYWCFAPFRRRSGAAHDKGVKLYGSIFSRLAALRCRWTAWRVAVHECTRAKVHTHARLRARHPPVSVSVSSLTGNPALSNVPRGSQLERIRLEGWGLHGRVFGDLLFYFAWLFTEMNGPIETSNGLYSSMNMQVSSTWHCMTSWWFLFIFPTVIIDVWL